LSIFAESIFAPDIFLPADDETPVPPTPPGGGGYWPYRDRNRYLEQAKRERISVQFPLSRNGGFLETINLNLSHNINIISQLGLNLSRSTGIQSSFQLKLSKYNQETHNIIIESKENSYMKLLILLELI
jgi:hypothetical protein